MSTRIFSLLGNIKLDGMDKVEASIKGLEAKLKPLQKTLGNVGRELSSMGAALSKNITAPMAAAGAALGVLALKTGQYADKLLDLKEITGLSTDSIQEFEHVARAAGVSSDGFLNVIQRLNRALPQIAEGTGTQAEAMNKLGISVTNADGSFRDMNDLFPEIIGQLQGMDDITERNILASQLFGRNLRDVAPILGMTAAEMAALRQEAHDTGKVMGEDAIKSANDFRISVENLKADLAAAGREIATAIMPVLNEQLIPFIQTVAIPALKSFAEVVGGVAGAFSGLPGSVQNTMIILGGLVAAAGPALLMLGKIVLSVKSLIPTLVSMGATLKVATVAFKKFAVVAATNPLTWIAAALAGLTALVLKTQQLKHQYEAMNAETEMETQRAKNFQQQAARIKEQIDAMEKLRGTTQFNAAEFERLVTAYENVVVQFKNGTKAMTDEETETTRRNIQARFGLEKAAETTEKQMTDVQRREAAERARIAAEERKRRIEELNKMVEEYVDKYEDMFLDDGGRIDKEEENAVKRAKALGASEEQLYSIYEYYNEQRQRLADEAEIKELERIESIEKARESTNKEWDNKLLQQSGDRLAILDAEYADALAKAAEHGADLSKVDAYYAEERVRIQREIADKRFEEEKNLSIKMQEEAERQAESIRRTFESMINFGVGAVNKLGSIFSQSARNEEQRLSRQYKERKEYIEQTVEDEEERSARLQALQEEEDAKRLSIQREQAKRDKALGIFNTIVDTAAAVVKALQAGPIAGPVMAGVIGALGVAQTAVIASTPEPFAAGALIEGGRGGVHGLVGEGKQDELIMPMETGVERLAEALFERLDAQTGRGEVRSATVERPIHINIGTLIGDDRGLTELERRLRPIRFAEDRRTGARL